MKNCLAANCAIGFEFNLSLIRVFSRAFAAKKFLSAFHLRKSAANPPLP